MPLCVLFSLEGIPTPPALTTAVTLSGFHSSITAEESVFSDRVICTPCCQLPEHLFSLVPHILRCSQVVLSSPCCMCNSVSSGMSDSTCEPEPFPGCVSEYSVAIKLSGNTGWLHEKGCGCSLLVPNPPIQVTRYLVSILVHDRVSTHPH